MVFKKGNVPWNKGKKCPQISRALKGRSSPLKGRKRPKLSEALMGRRVSEETRRKISIAKTGIKTGPPSEETRRKMSEALKGRVFSEETRRRMSESHKGCIPWNKGKKCPELSRKQMGENNSFYGKKHTEEYKLKMRAVRLSQVISQKDTSIEVALQAELDKRDIKFKKHVSVCGVCQPDIVFPDEMVAVFADGDYWHSKDFDGGKRWTNDRRQDRVLGESGWHVLRFWGSEIKNDVSLCVDNIEAILD